MKKKTVNICKKILYNPLFVALLLTSLIIIIIVAIYKVQSFGAGMIFKCGFYIFITISIIIFVHDFFIKKELGSTHINKEVKEVFSGIDISKELSHDVIKVEPVSYDEGENERDGQRSERDRQRSEWDVRRINESGRRIGGKKDEDSNGENSDEDNEDGENSDEDGENSDEDKKNNIDKIIATGDVNNILNDIVPVSISTN
jgi:hypothetical protein